MVPTLGNHRPVKGNHRGQETGLLTHVLRMRQLYILHSLDRQGSQIRLWEAELEDDIERLAPLQGGEANQQGQQADAGHEL